MRAHVPLIEKTRTGYDQRSVCTMQCFRFERGGLLAEVRLQEGETLENALRRFKRKVLQEGIIQDVKRARLLSEARPKAAVEAGASAQTEPEENTRSLRMTGVQ
jgi:small subunit ribosomal protein S21